ncbi:related to GTPase-activating protein of the rho/rac family (LRG1 protein) [Melanopsichium pennsylvanicum]|uniref:Related to GTPase-activating protein of the rho/rac family (LRG1 protein) n=2 Tax=Melanopsichium pennsylvanicum TaxID=63383 RepID=A0AAJ5C8E6_9BASI|nr:related to GTPase-activating protein of the rho/rac family (LRG1 protein) [Melanopsichium pennsylvanicum]
MSDSRYTNGIDAASAASASYHTQSSSMGQSDGGSSYYFNIAHDTNDLNPAIADMDLSQQTSPASTSHQRLFIPSAVPMAQSRSHDPTAHHQSTTPTHTRDNSAHQQPLRPSTSFGNGVAGDSSTSRNRADMDRIKSRAVDPGWSWEKEREKYETAGSIRSNSVESRPSLPSRGSSRRTPRLDTASVSKSTDAPQSCTATRYSTTSNVASPHNLQAPPNPISGATHERAAPATAKANANANANANVNATSSTPTNVASSSTTSSASSQVHKPAHPVQPASTSGTSSRRRDQTCQACGKVMTGQFVRALGSVYHLDCFRCNDCNKVVAAKFFPATDDMVDSSATGRLFPLCETDYFRRLDLICAKCSGALRGSYITALGRKFHVEHFTCSVCPTVFGPQDSYYEHDGDVFCHFHYSTRFAIKCTGCKTAILKQFVEINRNNTDEHWHPECYMIHKFWNIKLCPTGSTPKDGAAALAQVAAESSADSPALSQPSQVEAVESSPGQSAPSRAEPSPDATEIEAAETPSSLKHKQKQMEERVYRIWTVLSAFEESSAACISEMLRHVSSGRYLGGVRMAEKFILHVEILFSAIDDLETNFRKQQAKGISHIREARMLCKKIVNFFSLLSHTQETGARRMGITQELLSLVTGLAHYLKILIRIALTGALKLDREYGNEDALHWFLSQLAFSAKLGSITADDKQGTQSPNTNTVGPDGRWYGYKSLPRSTSSGSSENGEAATDLCVACGSTVEEECLRIGVNLRWHSNCLKCSTCQRPAMRQGTSSRKQPDPAAGAPEAMPASQFGLDSKRRHAVANAAGQNGARAASTSGSWSHACFCPSCTNGIKVRMGFESVTRLEQYAFLLRVALNRLFALLRKRGVVPPSPPVNASRRMGEADASTSHAGGSAEDDEEVSMHEAYRDSQDIKRMKSVNLNRKLSTKAKVPRISTVVGSPSGRQTQTSDTQRPSPSDSGLQMDSRQSPRQVSPGSSPRESSSPFQRDGTSSREPSPSRRPRQPQQSHNLQQQPSSQKQQVFQPVQQHLPFAMPSGHQPPQLGIAGRWSPSNLEPGSIVPIRPAFARHNTDVKIREDGPVRQASGDELQRDTRSEDGITLADIPHILEAEQAREQHRPLPLEGTRCISELSALELFIVRHMAVMYLQQSALRDHVNLDDLIEFIETRKNTFWGKIFKGGKDKKEIKKKGVFGIPLEILVERNGADSTLGASAAHLRVPSFIDDVICAMKQMDLSVEGIFRKNGNIRRLKELSEALDRDSSQVNLLDDNPVQLAALLKKFLRELPDPLMTFKLHKLFVMSQKLESEAERHRILHMVTILLPKGHRDTMEVLFAFLKWVASFSHIDEETGSKMDLPNLATVICPNILYSKGSDPTKDETFLANRAVSYLLEHQDEMWKVPEELEAVLLDKELMNSSADLTSRDILKKCEKYARLRQQRGGGVGMGRNGSGGPLHSGELQNRHRPDVHPPTTMRQVHQREQLHFQQQQQQVQLQMQMQQQGQGQGQGNRQYSSSNGASTPLGTEFSRSPDTQNQGPWSAGAVPPSNHFGVSPTERTTPAPGSSGHGNLANKQLGSMPPPPASAGAGSGGVQQQGGNNIGYANPGSGYYQGQVQQQQQQQVTMQSVPQPSAAAAAAATTTTTATATATGGVSQPQQSAFQQQQQQHGQAQSQSLSQDYAYDRFYRNGNGNGNGDGPVEQN